MSSYQILYFISAFSCNCFSIEKSYPCNRNTHARSFRMSFSVCQIGKFKVRVVGTVILKRKEGGREGGRERALVEGKGSAHTCLMWQEPWGR